jgi:hypothetical protein
MTVVAYILAGITIVLLTITMLLLGVWALLSMYWWLMGDVILYKRRIQKQRNKIQ